jgi:hypothetical protein
MQGRCSAVMGEVETGAARKLSCTLPAEHGVWKQSYAGTTSHQKVSDLRPCNMATGPRKDVHTLQVSLIHINPL